MIRKAFTFILKFALIAFIGIAFYIYVKDKDKGIPGGNFRSHKKEFRADFDSLKSEMRHLGKSTDTLKSANDTILQDLEQLKSGQNLIYENVKKELKDFWDWF